MAPKRHRWTPDPGTEGAEKCKDCLMRRRASDPGDGDAFADVVAANEALTDLLAEGGAGG